MLDIVNDWGVGVGLVGESGLTGYEKERWKVQEDRKGGLRASQPNRKAPTGGYLKYSRFTFQTFQKGPHNQRNAFF